MGNRWTMTSAERRSGPRPRTCTKRRRTPRRRSSSTRRRGGASTVGSSGSPAAALAAVSGVGGLAKLLSFSWAGGIAAARQTTEKAGVAANALRALQQDARIFLQIDLEVMAIEDARTTLQSLIDRQQQLSREAVIPHLRPAIPQGFRSIPEPDPDRAQRENVDQEDRHPRASGAAVLRQRCPR